MLLQRLAPDGEHGVGRQQRVAQHAGLLGVGLLGLAARAGVAEVEVAGDAQQLVGPDRAARAARTVRDVGLDRPQVGAPVEDDGQRLGQGQPAHAHGHGDRRFGVDEGPAQQLVGVVAGRSELLVHRSLLPFLLSEVRRLNYRGTNDYRHLGGNSIPPGRIASNAMKLIYKPFGIIFGILAGILSKKLFEAVWGIFDKEEPPKPTTQQTTWPKVIGAAVVEGVTFKVTRAAVDRAGAKGFAHRHRLLARARRRPSESEAAAGSVR